MLTDYLKKLRKPPHSTHYRTLWQCVHLDVFLFPGLLLLATIGLVILFSASSQNPHAVELQAIRLLFSFALMFSVAQIPPVSLQRYAPALYVTGLILLIVVLLAGHIGKGAQRWLDIGIMRFQPAEIMKLAIPLLLASYYHHIHLPVRLKSMLITIPIIFIPAFLTAKQPDLGTAILLFGCQESGDKNNRDGD